MFSPPDASWGNLITEGAARIEDYWWLIVYPGSALAITLFSLNFLGDGVRDALDPQMEKGEDVSKEHPSEPLKPLLRVENLRTSFRTSRGTVTAVNGISFEVYPGETPWELWERVEVGNR